MKKHIIAEQQGQVLSIILNRPDKKNAISNVMYEQICSALDDAAQNPGIRVVLLRSSSENFTSGNDLADFASVNQGTRNLSNLPVLQLLRTVIQFEKPLVVAVKGLAVGIGTTLLLHCDMVFAGRSAVFQMPFVPLGLVPEFASSYLLPITSGRARANMALLLGKAFDVQRADDMGLISEHCEDDALDRIAMESCQQLAALPPSAVRASKQLITPIDMQQKLLNIVERESAIFADHLRSDEHREALTAFFEKRRPDFSNFG